MKHYISPTGQLYAYESNGSQDHIIPADYVIATPEQVSAIQNPPSPVPTVQENITALEATITPRRLRESVLTDAGKTWLVSVDSQIAALRATLIS